MAEVLEAPRTLNLQRLEEAIERSGLDALVAASGENVFYLAGVPTARVLGCEHIALVVWPRELEPTFIVRSIDESPAKEACWIKDVRSYVEFAQSPIELLVDVLRERGLARRTIGLEKKFLTVAQCDELVSLLATTGFVACDHVFDSARAAKTDQEVAVLTKAANIAEEAVHRGLGEARVGVTEKAVLDSMTAYSLAQGGAPTFCALSSGLNTAHAHWEAGAKELQRGDLVVVDFCGLYKGYNYDMARTAVVGKPSAEQQDTYRRLWQVQRKIIAFMAPGLRACEVYRYAEEAFEEEGLPRSSASPHVGHGIGISIHEKPMMEPYDQTELEPNMICAIEPCYVVPGVCGYQIEDLVRITETGTEILSDLYETSEILAIGD